MASQQPITESLKSKVLSDQAPTSIPEQPQPQPAVITAPLIRPFKYSNRVLLKAILERKDGGVGLVGEKMVIGGWVKSYKELKKQPSPLPQPDHQDIVATDSSPGHKDFSCIEILQARVPLFRSIAKIFSGATSNYTVRTKLEPSISRPPLSSSRPSLPSVVYLLVSDGSCVSTLQVSLEFSESFPFRPLPTGTCILAEGVLNQLKAQGMHSIELKAEKILHIATVEDGKYPLSKKRLPLESLRDFPHFRPRTTTVASLIRIRSSLTFGTHTFFQNHGFLSVETPIITTTDSEGFSERLRVSTLAAKEVKMEETKIPDDTEGVSLEDVKAAMKEKNNLIQQLKRSESNREALLAAEQDFVKTNQLAVQLEAKEKLKPQTRIKPDKVNNDAQQDFFSQQAYLTVSGILHLESYACALCNVYSFGPRFRASKHLAEMWIVEAQMAFSQLEDAMTCAEDYFKFLCKWVLENCAEDMKFVTKRIDNNRINLLEAMIGCSYERISYTKAVEIMEKVSDKKFDSQPGWGISLTAQHLSYLADEIYKSPVIVYNHPKEVKPFYARLNDDGKTVAAFDMVIPRGGTFITGSQNEERIDILEERIKELRLGKEQYEWYLDLRRHGTVKHSGFSVGFDAMVVFATGIPDVRDAIPFPITAAKVNT